MANRKPQKIQDFNGSSIYQDPKHGSVYYDIFTKRAFSLTSSDVQACLIYTALFPIALVVMLALISFFKVDAALAIGGAVGAYILAQIGFRVFYFYKLPIVQNWKPVKRDNPLISFAKKYSIQRLAVLAILFVVIAILTVIYTNIDGSTMASTAAGYIMSACCVGATIYILIALIIKKKNNY